MHFTYLLFLFDLMYFSLLVIYFVIFWYIFGRKGWKGEAQNNRFITLQQHDQHNETTSMRHETCGVMICIPCSSIQF